MEYKITDESKAKAIRVFEKKFGMIPEYTASAFAAALDALCVPADDGWRPLSGKPHNSFRKGLYRLIHDHGGWRLYHVEGQWPIISTGPLMDADKAKCWADEQIIEHQVKAIVDQALKAGKITPAQREWALEWCRRDRRAFLDFVDRAPVAHKSGTCVHCGLLIYLQRDGVWYHQETTSVYCNDRPGLSGFPRTCLATPREPKPFGPGTRLRLGNGDELLVVRYDPVSGPPDLFMAVNLTANCMVVIEHRVVWMSEISLLQTLDHAGATIVE